MKKKYKVRVPLETLVNAYSNVLYFNETVKKVRITIKKNSNQLIQVLCTGRGKLRATIKKDVAEIWVSGTEEEVLSWDQFFREFATVPEFSLRDYIDWAKGIIKLPKTKK